SSSDTDWAPKKPPRQPPSPGAAPTAPNATATPGSEPAKDSPPAQGAPHENPRMLHRHRHGQSPLRHPQRSQTTSPRNPQPNARLQVQTVRLVPPGPFAPLPAAHGDPRPVGSRMTDPEPRYVVVGSDGTTTAPMTAKAAAAAELQLIHAFHNVTFRTIPHKENNE